MMRFSIICLLFSAVAISANLQSDFDDIISHFPMKKVESLYRIYLATDPSLREAVANLQKLSAEQIYKTYVSPDLIDFFKRHGVDAERVFVHLIEFSLEFDRKILKQEPSEEDDSNAVQITGNLLADLSQLMHSSEVYPVVFSKLQSSPEFAHFAAALADPELKTLIYRKMNPKMAAGVCFYCNDVQLRGWFSKLWNKIFSGNGVSVSTSIPFEYFQSLNS